MAAEIECCLFCGRDTRDRSRICQRCLEGDSRPVGSETADLLPAEDDYSEESGPDSVCLDHIGLDALSSDNPWRPDRRRGRLGIPL